LNKRSKLLMAIVLLGGGLWIGSVMTTNAETAPATQPGGTDDPIVTKSYVDQQIKANMQAGTGTGTSTGGTSPITVIQLQANQTLIASPGAEVIVRTGKTLAVSSDDNGIPDVTGGKDIRPGAAIETNHLLIFPREGRGIKPDPKVKGDIFVMVRGGYQLTP
jgi:hypothetical protein